jgi:hypothetical protein
MEPYMAKPFMQPNAEKSMGAFEFGPDEMPDPVGVKLELERILASRGFRHATSQARFLRYAVEQTIAGRGHLIREHRIGSEGFGRGDSFDPRLDPIVRTQARKLRGKLTLYYATSGRNDPIRIEMIKGSYRPRFRIKAAQISS